MIITKTAALLDSLLKARREAGETIGFVPTMGALHQGHISLVTDSKKQDNRTVCSIFVNPTQFNNPVDFEKYPITIENDINLLEASGCDILFLPSKEEIYPEGTVTPNYDIGYLETVLEGEYRPGHYQGVCMVVERLLNIVKPASLYLGQKDYQQCMVITKLLQLKNIDTDIYIANTLRENDGLAMSSRNARLNKEERKQARHIFEALSLVKQELKPGPIEKTRQKAINLLTSKGFKVDYVQVAGATDLQLLDEWDGKTSIVVLIAAWLNDVRLIDNIVIS